MFTTPSFSFFPSLSKLPLLSDLHRYHLRKKQKKLFLKPRTRQTEVLRKTFVKHLIHHNQLRAFLPSGEVLTVYAASYDRINSHLIMSDQAENGLLYLEDGDKVEFFTDLNDNHEYFSFESKVIKIRVKGVKLTYYMSVPKVLKKSLRRVVSRVAIKNHSIIRIEGSQFFGRVVKL